CPHATPRRVGRLQTLPKLDLRRGIAASQTLDFADDRVSRNDVIRRPFGGNDRQRSISRRERLFITSSLRTQLSEGQQRLRLPDLVGVPPGIFEAGSDGTLGLREPEHVGENLSP